LWLVDTKHNAGWLRLDTFEHCGRWIWLILIDNY
jgi:hypothetical protein